MKHKNHKNNKKMVDMAPAMDDKYMIESAARSLIEAEKVRSNKKLFASAKGELKKMSEQAKKAMS